MDFSEPEHLRMLRDSLRKFVAQKMPRAEAARWDKENFFPVDAFESLAELGVIGLTVPEEHGGIGRDILSTMVVIEELSKRSLAVAVPYIMAACYAGMNIVECGSDTQKQTLLPKVAAGKLLFAYGWTEPDIGADLASVKSTAVRDGDELVINGEKRFCSGAAFCDFIYALVRTGAPENRYDNLSLVLIPSAAPGVSIRSIDALGMKGAATTDVGLLNVRVPVKNVVGEEAGWNRGWSMITGSGLDVEKLEVAAMSLGIATAAFEDAWNYSSERQQFGKSIATYQSIRHKLADMQTQLHGARLMLYHAAWLADKGERCGVETSMTKLFVTETAKSVALECQTILGAYGYVKEFDMERYVRDALLMPIIGGSSAIQRNNIVNWSGLAKA
ncbi:alkylation response protein AidB-like acyl-CoA dehydrogenase [Aminobacter aminovorans]|uniref:Crotonobetainyl-CoA dehydrogenase n=1 Tax=Aminobacter aminovorans TaxID=83263 RepID=A0A381ILM5_AMIAI|nr:acyl-CoA dehydrogenase family protein [Aminobacter aminovorans]TCS25080.1 alkylation response protein AidB-like acyl-CoA dehydrogenase [Aminobacter aminovorans]SUY28408.1 Crotonobetainyl-CoA dehydrogenase [Aminobacter aminovorans]